MTDRTLLIAPVGGEHGPRDAELICAGQILHRDGLLDRVDIDDLNARIGRAAGAVDLARGAWRLLFDHGYTRFSMHPLPDLDHVSSFDEWVAELEMLGAEADGEQSLRRNCPLVAQMQKSILQMRAGAGPRWHHEQQRPELGDINRFIDWGWSLMVSLSDHNGWTRRGLVLGRLGGDYQVYDPAGGIQACDASVFRQHGEIRELEAWRR